MLRTVCPLSARVDAASEARRENGSRREPATLLSNGISIASGGFVELSQQMFQFVGLLIDLVPRLGGIVCQVEEFNFASVLFFVDDELPVAET